MSRDLTRTVHPSPPPSRARHRSKTWRTLVGSLAWHALGRGARLPQVQPDWGGSRVLAQTRPGETS